ncbi:MAG TPA: hypothetical protein DEA76_15445, partial [Erwinia persicina]|nr:hypothetical protein [Erwinia persicina]HBT51953.1 hypothetical protein [Erwinia persicina]
QWLRIIGIRIYCTSLFWIFLFSCWVFTLIVEISDDPHKISAFFAAIIDQLPAWHQAGRILSTMRS